MAARAPGRIAAAALLLLAGATSLYLTVTPSYSLFDNLNADDPTLISLRRLESRVAPTGATASFLRDPLTLRSPRNDCGILFPVAC